MMVFREWLSLASLISVLLSLVGLIITVRNYNRQVAISVALEFSARLRAAMNAVPGEVWESHLYGADELPESDLTLKMAVFRLFYQVRELFDFHLHGLIPERVWRMWRADIEMALQSELLKREWPKIRHHFAGNIAFCRYVDRLQEYSFNPG